MLQSDGFGPAYRDLARREPVFARLLTVYGRPDPFEWHDGGRTGSSQFAAMLLHIVGQVAGTRCSNLGCGRPWQARSSAAGLQRGWQGLALQGEPARRYGHAALNRQWAPAGGTSGSSSMQWPDLR